MTKSGNEMREGNALELWVGPECTINRLHDRWFDQSRKTGFGQRAGDLQRLASLGAARVRLPVLWEQVMADGTDTPDWTSSDRAIAELRALRLPAIMGLLHHGSGPRCTHLTHARFPALFADYARQVAERYPDQRHWTPINEPLTTARFSGLYGLWYPHASSDRDFVRSLLQQIHATVAGMREIRRVNPSAELIQTDDVGQTRSTPALAAQAAFDNHRKWLGFDLLCGRVDRHHPLWRYLLDNGASRRELSALRDAPCPPDLIGVNSYVTSERFLDERLSLYPAALHGGNGREAYVDIETARAHGQPIDGFGPRLAEAWARYRLPLAITEVHMGCTREEQLRWLQQAWSAALAARADGVDLRAVTAWAAFGSMDWESLLTRDDERYEPGLWDVRSDPPRLTAVGRLASELAHGTPPSHPVLAGPGWWKRGLRLAVPAFGAVAAVSRQGAPVLITGARGMLARAIARLCDLRGLPYLLLAREEMDIADELSVGAALLRHQPWAVINAAGCTGVDDAERHPRQWRDNAEGPGVLGIACERHGCRFLCFSSDQVFPGVRDVPYLEADAVGPLNAYGRAKVHAEAFLREHAPGALVVRTAALFGPWGDADFVSRGLAALRGGEAWTAATDQIVTPTYVPDLVQAALDLLIDGERGIWHLTNGDAMSWADLARQAATHAGLSCENIDGRLACTLGQLARRPDYSALHSERGMLLPSLENAMHRLQADRPLSRVDALPAQTNLDPAATAPSFALAA